MIFQNNSMLGIDYGSRNIKLIEGKWEKGIVTIDNMILTSIMEGIYNDGQLIDKDGMKQILQVILRELRTKTKNTSITLETSTMISREINLLQMNEKEMKQLLEFEIQQYLSIEMDQYVIQSKKTGEIEEEGSKKAKLQVSALSKSIVEEHFSILNLLGLRPKYLDTHSNGIDKLFTNDTVINNSLELKDKTIAVIDLGNHFINVVIINNGIFKFSRLLKLGGEEIDISIANSLNKSPSEAEELKIKSRGLDGKGDKEDIVEQSINSTVDGWNERIERIFRYYISRASGNAIDLILLHGGSSQIRGLEGYMKNYFQTPAHVIKDINKVKLQGPNRDKLPLFINSIGSIIRR